MLGINLRESASAVQSFKDQFHITYRLLLDPQGKVWNDYGMGYIPHNVVISPDWVVRYTNYGYDKQALIRTIEQWLPETAIQEPPVGTSPSLFTLGPAYPNPFVPESSPGVVRLRVSGSAVRGVNVVVFDVRGRRVRTLKLLASDDGTLTVRWDGRDEAGTLLPAGIYWFRATLDGTAFTRRVVLLR